MACSIPSLSCCPNLPFLDSPDRKRATAATSGAKEASISLDAARAIAARIGLPVPPTAVHYEGERNKLGQPDGFGIAAFADGNEFEGEWEMGEMEGRITQRLADGVAAVGRFSAGQPVGEGVRWFADRQTAWRTLDGEVMEEVLLDGAADRATDLHLLVPPRHAARPPPMRESAADFLAEDADAGASSDDSIVASSWGTDEVIPHMLSDASDDADGAAAPEDGRRLVRQEFQSGYNRSLLGAMLERGRGREDEGAEGDAPKAAPPKAKASPSRAKAKRSSAAKSKVKEAQELSAWGHDDT
jgi:hypothetical protein